MYTALNAASRILDLTLAITNQSFTASTVYFSLTTANAAAVTVDIHLFGDVLDWT